jgi:serine/threonine protein kinase
MSTPAPTCPRCGSTLSDQAASGGLCAKCLLEMGLGRPEVVITGPGEAEPPPSIEELAPRFPQLEILELVGRGGMGAVYKARQRGLDRLVALKILPRGAAKDPSFAERFAREARALARLSHPNIVAVHDSGEAGGLYFFAMEYVDGMNLRQMILARTAGTREALQIVMQVCDALQYAHEEGVVHRDIKPENILLDRRGRVKIADFGLAKLLQGRPEDLTLTGTHQSMGTPHYMAPEQLEKPASVDHRADIYSLGVVFYELLTGELPLGRFAPPSSKIQIDVRLDDVVLKTLSKEPELRYQQASQMKSDVETVSASAREEGTGKRGGRIRRDLSRMWRSLDPTTPGRKRLAGMELASNWIPLAIVAFLLLCYVASGQQPFFLFLWIVGTVLVVRHTR